MPYFSWNKQTNPWQKPVNPYTKITAGKLVADQKQKIRQEWSAKIFLFKESVMEKQKPKKTNASESASKQPPKETPEQMIRSLQGAFCKGRYRSWIYTQDKKTD